MLRELQRFVQPSKPRLQQFLEWLAGPRQALDPFACARCCDSLDNLMLLVDLYAHHDTTAFIFAGACVLQATFEQCDLRRSPESLSEWRALFADTQKIARVHRQSDLLWYYLRRDSIGFRFCRSVPAKAREDTLAALAIVAAVAQHDETTRPLVSSQLNPAGSAQTRMHPLTRASIDVLVSLCVFPAVQWAYAVEHLSPSTLVGLLDKTPLLGLSPLLCCYVLALVAALQRPHGAYRSGVLHGAKSVKTLLVILARIRLVLRRAAAPWPVVLPMAATHGATGARLLRQLPGCALPAARRPRPR